jgi:hypothetical protein
MPKSAGAVLAVLLSSGSVMAQPFPYLFPAQLPPPPKRLSATCAEAGQTGTQAARDRYQVSIDLRDWNRTYLADETLTLISQDGRNVIGVSCDAPWILLRVPPGTYAATASVPSGESVTRWMVVPAGGANSLTFTFAPPQNPPGLLPPL